MYVREVGVDEIDVLLSRLVVEVTRLRDEATALNRKADVMYEEIVEVALAIKCPRIGLDAGPVPADREETR